MTSQRIVCLIDMDCFYVQCEQRLQPEKWGKPCGVAQYNQWRGGGLIAVNYEARSFGIKRGMRTDDCLKLCADFHSFTVPERNGKAELTRYRNASAEVFDCITDYIKKLEADIGKTDLIILEKASIDEAFIDFTKYLDELSLSIPAIEDLNRFGCKIKAEQNNLEDWYNSVIENFDVDICKLLMGAYYVGDLRKHIHEKTQFFCSAGISANKMLSKLVCGVNKPNAQTILPFSYVDKFFKTIKIQDIRNLGGKAGMHIRENFCIETMGELAELSFSELHSVYDQKQANRLFMLAKGFDDEKVTNRRLCKSIGCGKQFPGQQALSSVIQIQDWIKILCEELYDRLEEDRKSNDRIAKLLTVTYLTEKKGPTSKSMALKLGNNQQYLNAIRLSTEIFRTVFQDIKQIEPIYNLSLSASKFIEGVTNSGSSIHNFFNKVDHFPMSKIEKIPISHSDQSDNVDNLIMTRDIHDNNAQHSSPTKQPKMNKIFKEFESSFFFNKIEKLYKEGKLSFLDE